MIWYDMIYDMIWYYMICHTRNGFVAGGIRACLCGLRSRKALSCGPYIYIYIYTYMLYVCIRVYIYIYIYIYPAYRFVERLTNSVGRLARWLCRCHLRCNFALLKLFCRCLQFCNSADVTFDVTLFFWNFWNVWNFWDFYILPPGAQPIMIYLPYGRIVYAYLPYSTPLWNRFGAVFGCVCRLRREIFISQNWLKG